MQPKFSILVVCLNPGEKLRATLNSIKKQTYMDYEVVIKDGLSTDGSMEYAKEAAKDFPSLRIIEKQDAGIYDAMNQAASSALGKYVYFLNCGDAFYDKSVLENVNKLICENPSQAGIYYGNIYERLTENVVASNPRLDAFGCYRNVPCHQACFYDKKLLETHPFETKYRVRADYEQFLWCFFTKDMGEGVSFFYKDILIADYEGGGFSETRQNRKLSAKEHQEIVRKYMPIGEVRKYRILMWVTLSPLRTWFSRNKVTSGLYNGLKKIYYGKGIK